MPEKSIDEQRLELEKSVHKWQKKHSWKGPLLTGIMTSIIGGGFAFVLAFLAPAITAENEARLQNEEAKLAQANSETEKILYIALNEPRENQAEIFCDYIERDVFSSDEARSKLASLTDNSQTCYDLAEERAKLEEEKKQCASKFVYVTKGCRAYDKSGFHSKPSASCGISLVAGQDRFFSQERVEVVSEYYRKLSGRKVVDAIRPKKPKDKNYVTSFSGRIGCTNSSGTGRTCETKATVRAKSYPLSCLGKI